MIKKYYIGILVFALLFMLLLNGCNHSSLEAELPQSEAMTSSFTDASTSISSAVASVVSESDDPTSRPLLTPSETLVTVSGDYYSYDENGKMMSYFKGSVNRTSEISSADKLPEEELRQRGEEYLKDKLPLDKYTPRDSINYPDRQEMTFRYGRLIAGYNSFDFANVTVQYDGEIVGFQAPRVGIFDNVTVPEIDEAKVLEKLNVMVKEKWGDIPYEVEDSWILVILEDGTLAMQKYVIPNGEEIYTQDFLVPIE